VDTPFSCFSLERLYIYSKIGYSVQNFLQEELGGLMKNISYILAVLFLVTSGYVLAATEKTIDSSNEFGGITKESVYSTVDEQYKEGMLRMVRFLNSNGILRKREDYYTDAYAKEKGIAKIFIYLDSNGLLVKIESYSTDAYAKEKGMAKMVIYSDSNKKTEMYDQNGKLLQ
jgi:hypothetical protein